MGLSNWKKLSAVDVSKYVEQRQDEKGNEFDYIPWVSMLRLLYDNGAESVTSGVYSDPQTGHAVHMTEQGFTDKYGVVNHAPFVHVWVNIDGNEYDLWYPVISGSFVVKDINLNQQRIATAITRAQCKCIAINTGLGISLWEKNDESDAKSDIDIVQLQSADNLFKKLGTMVTELIRDRGLTEAEIASRMGLDTERIGDVIRVDIQRLKGYEKALEKIANEK